MILNILQFLGGSLLALFLPGFLVVLLLFKELKILEKIVFSIAFSIMISIAIAIFFGYDEAQAAKTGGLTLHNILVAEAWVNGILLIAVLLMYGIPFLKVRRGKKKSSHGAGDRGLPPSGMS